MTVYEAKNYVLFVRQAISSDGKKKHGIVKSLAEQLRCHPTFISQVVGGKADLNHDQAIRLCKFLGLSEEETEFFIDLLNRDRAASTEAKEHFQKKLDRRLSEHRVFQKRANLSSSLRVDHEVQYLSRWICPVAHAAIQIPAFRTAVNVAKILEIEESDAKQALETLSGLKLAKKVGNQWVPTEAALHVGKDSPLAAHFHAGMRLKTASNLVTRKRKSEQTHFSSVFAISKSTVEEIRAKLLQSLKEAREEMVNSEPEVLYGLCLDYYPMSKSE